MTVSHDSSMTFLNQVADGCAACKLQPGKLLLGVSGGADSLALLHALRLLRESLSVEVRVAHFHHGLRAAADEDAHWLSGLCESLAMPLVTGRADVRTASQTSTQGIEEAARTLRYNFLQQTAEQWNCTQIAVAHHADDQVETVLHHLLRGTGLAGLRGMQPVRELPSGIRLLRPLLAVSRVEIEQWLTGHGFEHREDLTNTDIRLTRNRLRHELLPLLREQFNSRVDQHLLTVAQQAADAQSTLEWMADSLLAEALRESSAAHAVLDRASFLNKPGHLVRECFRRLWIRQQWPRQAMTAFHWNKLSELCETGSAVTLPGRIQARVRRGEILIHCPADS